MRQISNTGLVSRALQMQAYMTSGYKMHADSLTGDIRYIGMCMYMGTALAEVCMHAELRSCRKYRVLTWTND